MPPLQKSSSLSSGNIHSSARTIEPHKPESVSRNSSDKDTSSSSSSSSSSVSSLYVEDSPEPTIPELYIRSNSNDDAKRPLVEKPTVEKKQWRDEITHWNKCVLARSVRYGPKHLRTAEALMNLGFAQLSAQEYVVAGKTYLSALKIYQHLYGDCHVSVARALDKVGLAASLTHKNLDLSLVALKDALKVRRELLGPDHIDSIDSLNNVAGVRLNLRQFEKAAKDYKMVMKYREGIFGRYHASVAVTAYKLACILDDQLDREEEAREYFQIVEEIYETLGLKQSPYLMEARNRLKAQEGPQEF